MTGRLRDPQVVVGVWMALRSFLTKLYRSSDDVANHENDASLQVLVVGATGGGGIGQYIEGLVDRLNVSVAVHDTGSPSSGSGVRWLLAAVLSGLGAMARLPFRDRPELVHVHSSYQYSFYRTAFYVFFAQHVWNVPVVFHVHGSSFDGFVNDASPLVTYFQRLVFASCDRIIILSEYWQDILRKRTDESKLRVVPNAVDPELYPEPKVSDPPRIIFVSNLVERKGVKEFVTAIDSLIETNKIAFETVVAGDGPLAPAVTDLAERHSNVTYLGYVSEERKRSLLSEGSIFVLPTYAEGLPIAMLEAMAGGNALITTAVGSIPEVVDADNGIVIPPGDPVALRDATAELLAAPERRRAMGRSNRRAIEETYAWDAVLDSVVGVYRETLNERDDMRAASTAVR